MNSIDRRKDILNQLEKAEKPLSATHLANKYSVTRQIIVVDIALLRATGVAIRSEHKGYVLDKAKNEYETKIIVVNHNEINIKKELYAIVDNGGKVINVIIEHSVYGQISAELNLDSRLDVDNFIKKVNETGASPLSMLTQGLHMHKIAVKDEESFNAIIDQLTKLNILIEYA